MRTRGVSVAALLLLASLVYQTTGAEDLYWEGEEDGSNEFLEVKQEDSGLVGHLRRLKRAGYALFSTETPTAENLESVTEDDDSIIEGKDDDTDVDGSGLPDNRIEPEPREKTLRVSFVVMEPYKNEYSNRDSIQFQNFSKSLADAVNALFESMPGTQKASLVRIQSRLADEFTCKVTLDIVTTGYEDTDRITETLRNHIRNRSVLGTVTVYDMDFSANVIDPGSTLATCASNELQCDDGTCIVDSARCNGYKDCGDGSDEANCSTDTYHSPDTDETAWNTYPANCSDPITCSNDIATYCPNQKCDGIPDCPEGDDEENCYNNEADNERQRGDQTLEIAPNPEEDNTNNLVTTENPACYPGDIRCDETRCVSPSKRCDSIMDCDDGTDELGCDNTDQSQDTDDITCSDPIFCSNGFNTYCPNQKCDGQPDCPDGDDEVDCNTVEESCGGDDFRCDTGKCIPSSRRCDRVVDCQNEEDEKNCECTAEEFRCVSDGICIESRKRCDGTSNCRDGSDEEGCGTTECPPDHFTCDLLSSVRCGKRCDGISDCDSGEDEGDCPEGCSLECDGKCLDEALICDSKRDCSDGRDEVGCSSCDDLNDYRCDNGECINVLLRCNNVNDCLNGEDERDCNHTMIPTSGACSSTQFTCKDGACINNLFVCDGNYDCVDESDEENCRCDINSWQCRDGRCIPNDAYCDGNRDCEDGTDEDNCTQSITTQSNLGAGYDSFSTTTQRAFYRPEPSYPDGTRPGGDPTRPGYGQPEDPRNRYDNRPNTERYIPSGPPPPGPQGWPRYPGTGSGLYGETTQNPSISPWTDVPNIGGVGIPPPRPFGSDGSSQFGNGPSTARPYPDDGNNRRPQGGGSEYDQSGSDYNRGDGGDQSGNGYDDNQTETGTADGDLYGGPSGGSQNGDNNNGDPYGGNDNADQYGGDGNGDPYGSNTNGNSDDGNGNEDQYGSNSNGNPVGGNGVGDQYGGTGNGDLYGGNGNGDSVSGNDNDDQYGGNGNGGLYGGIGSGGPSGGQSGGEGTDQSGNGYPSAGGSGDVYTSRPSYGSIPSGGDQFGPGYGGGEGGDGYGSRPGDGNNQYGNTPSSGNQFGSGYGGGPSDLALRTVPNVQEVRYDYGGDAVFQCRDEGPLRVPVRWVREGGKQLKPGSIDRKGRLELFGVTPSDSGVYICQAVRFTGSPGSEVRVTLNVNRQSVGVTNFVFRPCKPHEATCGNGQQCIPKTATCDGKIDCADGSDEDSCFQNGMCEPNQYQCRNHKCVLKTWLCDSEDDCGDGSDEADCNRQNPGDPCLSVEFACRTGGQCVPKSFHCDGQHDCLDKSDEIGCASIYVTQPPTPSFVTLEVGGTLTLTCHAVGVPVPLISWRLNWGHVPPQCNAVSENGTGTLTCPNMQHVHSGAYSCEAINNKGTTFAIPDAIVFVNKSDPCPHAYFNSEARTESECIRCFCFGKSQTCHSADLFLYNMPTPLGQGGTRLVGVSQAPNGDVRTDVPIGNQYHYEPQRNGASVTKMDPSSVWSVSNDHPYVTLPESYNGKQLTSYGGHIKYVVRPHSDDYAPDDSGPTIIIKGKYGNLFHYYNGPASREIVIEARLTPNNWLKPSPRGPVPASREDIMMTLDHIEMILLRADLNNAGVIISDFTMESAQSANVGLGAASLVEECTCPRGYDGLSCEKCAFGFTRTNSDPWHGDCVPETCPPGTYGDPENGVACAPCPCPLTSPGNQFASTCSIGPRGDVVCDCHPGYEGDHCESCAPGYVGNPLIPGDSCKPKPTDKCNPVGTSIVRLPDECVCKENVQGRYCESCKDDSFYLSKDFRNGCALCFCSGVSQDCSSTSLRRKTTAIQFNMPQIFSNVKIYKSSPTGQPSVRYTAPVETEDSPATFSSEDRSSTVYYWSLPTSFSGDKVTSYGGYLKYTLRNVPEYNRNTKNNAADVQLISDNQLTFQYSGNFTPSQDGIIDASIKMIEEQWQRSDGKEISREHFLLALADVKTILIKVRYAEGEPLATPVSASIDTAETDGNGPTAYEVEQCVCPTGYIGTSCEDCAPGYTRSSSGLYLKHCRPCDCNGRSDMCNPETGVCSSCADNFAGEHCDSCKPGYRLDDYGYCVESEGTTRSPCSCDPRGTETGCDGTGVCTCKQNVEGENCDRCRPGNFGLNADNPLGCLSCYCSGITTECHEGSHYTSTPMAAPILGDNYGGFTLTELNGNRVIYENFVPVPNQSELTYTFQNPPSQEYYWSLPVFPGNRVLSYGGYLYLRQSFYSADNLTSSEPGVDVVFAGRDTSLYWSNPARYDAGGSITYQVPISEDGWFILGTTRPVDRHTFMRVLADLRRVLVRATVAPNILYTAIADVSMDTATQNYDSSFPASTSVEVCMCPAGYSGTSCESCASKYYKDRNGYCAQCPCNDHECQLDGNGQVYCNCRAPYTGTDCSAIVGASAVSPKPLPPVPQTTVVVSFTSPMINIREVGSSVNFTCKAYSIITTSPLRIRWSKVAGELPLDRSIVDELAGLLLITNLQVSDSGQYICETNDGVSTGQAIATLKVPGNDMTMPNVEINSALNEYYVGDRIGLQCSATGTPEPSITWRRANGYPLPSSAEHFDELFIIEDAREEDSGEYRCIATNPLGSVDRIAVITVRPRPSRPTREYLTISPTSLNLPEGQSSRVVCTGTPLIPADSIDWIRQDGYPLSENVRSISGILYIDNARQEDQGVYQCQSSFPGISPAQITVMIERQGTPSPGEVPNINVSVNSITIPSGETGTVDCNPTGFPPPNIQWKKYDGDFGPNTSQRGNTLIVSNAQDDDKGYYVCEGISDGVTVASTYVYVGIEKREAPVVEIWPQGEQFVPIGSQFEFHCRTLGGTPEPILTWSRGGSRVLSPHTQIRPNNLVFESVDVNDEGEYTCSATNAVGTVSASAVLKVRSPPEITITPSNQQEVRAGESAVFECRANGYPEPTVSIKTDTDMIEIVRPTPGIAVLRISAASERDSRLYTCTATSAAGTTQEQFQLIVERGDGGYQDIGEGSGDDEYQPERPQPPDYVQTPTVTFDGQTNEVLIPCNVTAGLQARWNRMDRPLQRNAIQRGSILYIYNVSTSDSGKYVCTLVDVYTGEVVRADYTSLVMTAPPRITLRPQMQTVRPGQSPTVECVVTGDDIIDVTWKPYNRSPSNRVEIRGSTLIFHQIEVEDAGKYECIARNRFANVSDVAEVVVNGPRDQGPASLVTIDQPRGNFRVSDDVKVLCRANGIKVKWERYGTNEFVDSITYGDGAMLVINGVQESDAGVYRCAGLGPYSAYYEDFDLIVEPSNNEPAPYPYPDRESRMAEYTAPIRGTVDMPCYHDLEPPANIEWKREYTTLPPEVRPNQPYLHLENVTEADAGIYVCRATNHITSVEARAVLRVEGVVPRFDGSAWLSLPPLKDAYRQFDIEISFNPAERDGLILYNGGKTGDYVALSLVAGIPRFTMETGAGPIFVEGDRPLQLNVWHTIRVSRTDSRLTMDVDNTGPFTKDSEVQWMVLELEMPMYIGGVPDFNQLPDALYGSSGYIGCVSMLILGREEKNIMLDNLEEYRVDTCNSCSPNQCLNNGVCQEARNERGYMCICAAGYAGVNCDRTGDACRPGLCGRGKCTDTPTGYKCACPINYTGKNCEGKQSIEYPAFTGSAYLALKPPVTSRSLKMSMKVKPTLPVTDGIIMYCAERARGHGGFTSLAVRNGKLEFRYDLGRGNNPVVLTSNKTLPANEWTDVHIARLAGVVSLKINMIHNYEQRLDRPSEILNLDTPMFVGGVDDSIVLNSNTGVTGGFSGCIRDVMLYGSAVDIVNTSIQSANVRECINERGDIPDSDVGCQCYNGGTCPIDSTNCVCPLGFTGRQCETRVAVPLISSRMPPIPAVTSDPCSHRPCRNGGICRPALRTRMNHTCDCPLGFAGAYCQMPLQLLQSVGFNGNGYVELPARLLWYDDAPDSEPAVIALAIRTYEDGVLLYQREVAAPLGRGDYILLRVYNGFVELMWDLGGGASTISVDTVDVKDGERHQIIAKLYPDNRATLSVDSYERTGSSTGLTTRMNADSNIYIGGIPEGLNVIYNYPGLTGCIEQVELMSTSRGINIGGVAVAGRNAQRCRDFSPGRV